LFLLSAALLVRVGVLLVTPDALRADPDGYRALAENLRDYGTFGHGDTPTAYRPPLYPLMLLPCVLAHRFSGFAIAAVHVALGIGAVWLTYHLGHRWGLSPSKRDHHLRRDVPALAALLVAADPILLRQSTLIMNETLSALLALAALAALDWAGKRREGVSPPLTADRRAALRPAGHEPRTANHGALARLLPTLVAGALTGAASLCRPTFLPWAVLAGLLLPFASWPAGRFGRLRSALTVQAAFFAGVAIALLPWVVRNLATFGRPIFTTTHGGYTLLLANNPFFYEHLRHGRRGSVWDAEELDRWRMANGQWRMANGEWRMDRVAYAQACRTITENPGTFCWSCLVRLGRLWSPLPHQLSERETLAGRLARYAVGVWYAAELGFALFGLILVLRGDSRRNWREAVLLVLVFSAVHTLYWTDMRMRAPLMPAVALAAAAGVLRPRAGLEMRDEG
jgi:hypothetical protein